MGAKQDSDCSNFEKTKLERRDLSWKAIRSHDTRDNFLSRSLFIFILSVESYNMRHISKKLTSDYIWDVSL